jgi:uncharacterized caspase-like protein
MAAPCQDGPDRALTERWLDGISSFVQQVLVALAKGGEMCFRCQRALLAFCMVAALAAATLSTPVFSADGSKRVALVVGNSAYENVSALVNPANDATDIGQKLKGLGFDVLLATDADHGKMSALLDDFKNRVTREHTALVFFAGHGVTVNNESFLLPVDTPVEIDLDEKGDLKAEAIHRHLVSMAHMLSPLETAKIGLVFLDACRTNASQTDRNLRVVSLRTSRTVQILRGTGSMEIKASAHSAGVFRAYATQLDNVASDGSGRNSPFTKALLKHIGTKGISIQEVMFRVRKSVMEETGNKQIPWEEAALSEHFYFVPTSPASPAPTNTSTRPASSPVSRTPVRSNTPARSSSPPSAGGTITGIR